MCVCYGMSCTLQNYNVSRGVRSRGNFCIVAAFVRKVLDSATRRDGNVKESNWCDSISYVNMLARSEEFIWVQMWASQAKNQANMPHTAVLWIIYKQHDSDRKRERFSSERRPRKTPGHPEICSRAARRVRLPAGQNFEQTDVWSWWSRSRRRVTTKTAFERQGRVELPVATRCCGQWLCRKDSDKFNSKEEKITLFRVTAKNISCGDWRLRLVLRTLFSQWRSGPRFSIMIFLWARVLFLPVFRPVVLAPYFFFHFCSPGRCWMNMICCTAVRGLFAWFFARDAHLVTLVPCSKRASMLSYDILLNRGLHLWFFLISIASLEPFSQMQQQCGSCPSIRGVVVILQITQRAIIHKHATPFSTEHRYNIRFWLNPAQSAHTFAVYDWVWSFRGKRWWDNNVGVFKLRYIRTHLWHILLGVQTKLI